MYRCKQGHFTDKKHDGKNCPYDNMSASELSSALVIDTEKKAREKYQAVMSGNSSRDLGKQPRINIQLFANKNLSKMGIRQLEKSVNSYRKRIEEHKEFISNPLLKYSKEKGESFSDERRAQEFAHWITELKAFRKNLLEVLDEIKKRG